MKQQNPIMLPAEVAKLFGVDSKTVQRWSASGKLPFFKTLGGHRRYRRDEIYALLDMRTSPRR